MEMTSLAQGGSLNQYYATIFHHSVYDASDASGLIPNTGNAPGVVASEIAAFSIENGGADIPTAIEDLTQKFMALSPPTPVPRIAVLFIDGYDDPALIIAKVTDLKNEVNSAGEEVKVVIIASPGSDILLLASLESSSLATVFPITSPSEIPAILQDIYRPGKISSIESSLSHHGAPTVDYPPGW